MNDATAVQKHHAAHVGHATWREFERGVIARPEEFCVGPPGLNCC